ncbi:MULTISPECIES: cupin domain-containing protein [unclassified Rhizobium]|uniref:cupin domain-containing protein n=1 Tax=unclassified Rhizobium TaxID=2613769 RepID=UPI001ADB9160|nr:MULTISPECIES: cupin domain-containing protein [unclassified Rhizobium]MBO9099692.1 cupin domain-containing protein [Rhizobium sp. L58/93]MBO9131776.1 cupin domain-containing protein [Rhizobium sp. B209b/85]MBO9169682.1 cupin domain-containing protein [Rhizobium sp. L245/93]MBO9185640.1 cupin domain-containing protein [Rhizobium sp. E27B/91]QXZ82406.1 cupin domain-containing protein [Rhizobium sp. K1/93]
MPQNKLDRVHRAGEARQQAPEGISSQPFLLETLIPASENGLGAMIAMLKPGTLTHWHSHPHGQILYVLSGIALVQCDGGPVEELHAGDSIRFEPGERHWHGSGATTSLAYLSVQAAHEGSAVAWFEPVTEGDRQ